MLLNGNVNKVTFAILTRKSILELNVVAGQLNLVNPDVNEQIMDIYTITAYPEYDTTNKRHDIALIRVKHKALG